MKQILKFRNLSSVTNMSSGNKYKLFIFHSYNRIICIYWTAIIVVHSNREINNSIKYFPIEYELNIFESELKEVKTFTQKAIIVLIIKQQTLINNDLKKFFFLNR
jgi:hypothetical protein